jgi:hypothetical protein
VTYLHLVPQLLKHADQLGGYRLEDDPFGQAFLERIAKTSDKTRISRLSKIEEVLRVCVPNMRLLAKVGYTGGVTFRITRGNSTIRRNLEKYKGASRVIPHIVLTDLDRYTCPPALFDDWRVGVLPKSMLLRIAVREAEAWLLADRKGIADFLHAALENVPSAPELVKDPKEVVAVSCRMMVCKPHE